MRLGRYIFVFILYSFSAAVFTPLHAVETIIVGEIVDELTGEAIPNVNIHFRGTKIGTTSDEHGNYVLRVDMTAKSQLVFSAVGYYTQRFDIEPGAMAGLQVAMREKTATLTEIVVAPNENPALELLRRVREHREATAPSIRRIAWSRNANRRSISRISTAGICGAHYGAVCRKA